MEGSLQIDGEVYNGVMPQHSFLEDKEIAQVLTYIRSSFGNKASEITTEEVRELRKVTRRKWSSDRTDQSDHGIIFKNEKMKKIRSIQ